MNIRKKHFRSFYGFLFFYLLKAILQRTLLHENKLRKGIF